MEKKVILIYDQNLFTLCNQIPAVLNRAFHVCQLIMAYNLHTSNNIIIAKSKPATDEELKKFHEEEYLQHLKTITDITEDYTPTEDNEKYGLCYDCFPLQNMYEFVKTIAGGTVTAAKSLMYLSVKVAINWCGGWHHAKPLTANGFCYINDIVIAIEMLKEKFKKILYVDLDIHHGDAVEEAFETRQDVFTLSYHRSEPFFYPGTGAVNDIGKLNGKGYTVNFPLRAAYSDDTIKYAFDHTFPLICEKFDPEALVIQCGADCLALDPIGGASLTLDGYKHCMSKIFSLHKPTLVLGGGGYHPANSARLWTSITALALGEEISDYIPDHPGYINYGPSYHLSIDRSNIKDINTQIYLDHIIQMITNNLKEYVKSDT